MLPASFQATLNRAIEESQATLLAVAQAPDGDARQQAKKQAKRKQILPGFPWPLPFQTHAEASAYLAQETLTCLVCGKSYHLLTNHLRDRHGIDADEYRAAYGIPWTAGLAGRELRAKKSDRLKEKLAAPEFASTWFSESENHRRLAHEKAKTQRATPFKSDLSRQHLEKAGIVIGRWQESHFLQLLAAMKAKDGLLKDVAGTAPDLPPLGAAVKWFYSTPVRHQLLVDTVHQLSPRSQARARLFSPKLIAEVRRLRGDGLLQREIGKQLGLSTATIGKLLKGSSGS